MADRKISLLAALLTAAAGLADAGAAPPAHLVPFPEDVEQAPAKPVKPEPPKSAFQPRFRAPRLSQAESLDANASSETPADIKQDDHVSPASAVEPLLEELARPTESESSAIPTTSEPAVGPALLPGPAADPGELSGRAALDAAYQRSKVATDEAEYDAIIALCEKGKLGVPPNYQAYADQLMGWTYNRRGEARAKAGDDRRALTDFETAVRLSGSWRPIHNRGVSYAAAGRMDEAAADFDRTIQLNPAYTNAYYNRAELRYRREDYMGAIEDYSQAIKLGPADAAMYNGRGHAFYRMERFGDALRDYGESIKLDPSNPDPLINRGDTHADLGQYGEAAADYRAAVKVAPENARAFQAAAWLMATCPDPQYRDEALAIDAAKRAIELEGETFRNLSTLAAAQASAAQFKQAEATQERAIAIAPKDQVVNGEKMMALYRREIAFRDRPLTAYETPEDANLEQVKQAALQEKIGAVTGRAQQAEYVEPVGAPPARGQQAQYVPPVRNGRYIDPSTMPQESGWKNLLPKSLLGQPDTNTPQQPPGPQKARLFGPKGRI
jgi:tetratricopeptide (TPR) repeat protein